MAKKMPVSVWMAKQRAKREPKFHQILIFGGTGRSYKEKLIIFRIG